MPAVFEERLGTSFGIDVAKVKQWCATYPPHHVGLKNFSQDAAVQFDLFFQIAGLNRKIRALSRRVTPERRSGDEVIEELKQCEAERERLIATLRHGE
jgi:hypothetical protein